MIAPSLLAATALVLASPQDEALHTTPGFLEVLERASGASIEEWFALNPTRIFVDTTDVLRDLVRARGVQDAASEAVSRAHATRIASVLGERPPAALLETVLGWDDAEHDEYHALARAVGAWRASRDGPPPLVVLVGYFDRAAALGADALLMTPFIALATRLREADRVEEAIELVHRLRATAEGHGDPYAWSWAEAWLGQVLWQRGALREAAPHLARAAELEVLLGDAAYRAKLLTDLAMVHLSLGELDEGRRLATEAEATALPLADDAPLRAARHVLASTYLDLGEHEEALALCLALAPEPPQPVPEDETQVRIDLLAAAVLSDIGRHETALTFAERAHRIASLPEVREEASLLVLEAGLALGLLLGDVGRGEEGLAHLDVARAAFAEADNPRGVAWAEKNRGWIHLRRGEFPAARVALARAHRIAVDLELPHLTALCAVGIAEAVVFDDSDPELSSLVAIDDTLDGAEELARQLRDVELTWRIAAARGRAARQRGDDEIALRHLGRAVDEIEAWRRRLEAPGLLTHALRDRADPYRGAAFAAARLGRTQDALRFSELLRARVLFELRAGHVAPPRGDDETRATLRRQIAALSFRLREGFAHQSPAERTEIHAALARAEADLDAARLAAEMQPGALLIPPTPRGEPVHPHWLFTGAFCEVGCFDSVLSYLVGEESTLAFHITARDTRIELLPVGRAALGAWIDRLRAPLDSLRCGELDLAHLDFDHRAARALHDALLAPFAAELGERVGIVADDCLTGVPFELFVAGGTPGPVDPAHPFAHLAPLSFAGQERALTYLASLATPPRDETPAPGSLVVFAAPEAVGVASWRDELRAVRGTGQRDVREVADATVADFRRLAPEAGIIHVVAHGFCDFARPSLGHLLLGDEGSKTGARLEAWQIESLDLSASLAILSACHTAEGAWFAGEGLVGLTRSFLAAGVDSVVASTWIVEDAATPHFMERLHHHLARGVEVDLALRDARRDLFRGTAPGDAALSHPWFWAGWVLHR